MDMEVKWHTLNLSYKENYIVDMVSTEFLNLQIDNHLHWKYHIQQMTPKLQGGADKSLAQPGRKQATVTKLRIYSTYSSRSSIHFLACCSNLCKPLKKKFRRLSVQPSLHGSSDLKNGNLSIVFSIQGTGGSPTGPDPENRVDDRDIGSPGRPLSSGLQVPGEPGHCRARTRPPW